MNLLLVQPDAYTASVGQSLGLGYLATAARRVADVEVDVLNLSSGPGEQERFEERLGGAAPGLIGASLYMNNFDNGVELIRRMRARWPETPVMIGGPQVSSIPMHCMTRSGADIGVVGEGEPLMVPVLEALAGGGAVRDLPDLPGLLVREAPDRVRQGLGQALVDDLDGGGFPAWDLMIPQQLTRRPRLYLYKDFPTVSVMTTRGCPYPCEFCSTALTHGKALRRRSATDVVDELEMLRDRYGVREITFEDDNLTLHRGHIVEICEEMIARDLGLWWKPGNGLRPDKLDRELLELMARSGCYQISLGTETGSEEVLERMDKKMSVDHTAEAIRLAKEQGLDVLLLIMMGFVGEKEADMRRTIEVTRRWKADLITVAVYTPLPGTRHFRELFPDDDKLDRIDWADFNFYAPKWDDPSRRKLVKRYQRRAILGFYLRPRTLAYVLKAMPFGTWGSYLKAFWRFIA